MKNTQKTKEQLLKEIDLLKDRIVKLEKSETERKKSEEQIKRFSCIFEDSLNEIYLFDAETLKFTQVNNAAQKNLGYTLEELQKMIPTDIKPELTGESFAKLVAPLRKGQKKKIVFETVHKRKDKSLYDVEVHLQLLHYDKESVYAAFILDITERKQAETLLHESENKFKALVTGNEEIIYIIDKDGTFILSEGKGLLKLGLKPGQVVGQSVFKLYKDYPDMLDEMRRTYNGETITSEVNIGGIYFRNWYTPQKNKGGEIIALLGMSINITETKQTEKALQKSNSLLSSIKDSPDNIIMFALDTNYNYLNFNKAHAIEMKNIYDADIQIGQYIFDYMPNKDDRLKAEKNYKRVLKGERFIQVQEYGISKNRSWYELIFNPILDASDQVTGFTVFVTNITERKLAEEDLNMYQEQLEKMVIERTKELEDKNKELDNALKVFVGRELTIRNLQSKIKALKEN